jgi:hypothetical protein
MNATRETGNGKHGFWYALQGIDRRFIYVILFIILTVTIAMRSHISVTPTSSAHRLYKAIEACPDDKPILVMGMWGYGTQGENWPQYEAIVYHCLDRGKKLVVAGGDAVSISLQNQIIENRVADIERHGGRKIVYGRDWINLGFKAGGVAGGNWGAYYLSLSDDVRGFYGNRDFKNNDLSKMPIMEGVRTAGDFYLVFEVAAGLEGIYTWVGIIRPKYPHVLYGGAVTAIVAPDAYPYVDSGQLVALIDGYRGAAEYEKLIGFDTKGRGHRQANAQTGAHVLILVLLALGNLGYFMTQRAQ